MSRVGKTPVVIPDKVNVSVADGLLTAKGPLGEQTVLIPEGIEHNIEGNELVFTRTSEAKKIRSMHGTVRALTANAVAGVSNGISKTLEIEGVGFKVELKGNNLMLSLGYSHPILFIPPDGISFETPNQTTINVKGVDKQLVGEVAARIRRFRKPEPYKGKGIRYKGEYIRRKAGKTAAK